MLENRVPPPIVAACIAALMYAVARVLPFLHVETSLTTPVALIVAAAGASLDLAGLAHFLRARTTFNPLKPDKASALVTGGLYRFTRNPMYLGLAMVLLGWAVYLANIAALAGPPLFILYMNRFQIAPEERALHALFGDEFAAYCRRVRRWI
jgi:protein-S-isoprenylcysteine O-methyltransferase Ste14